MATKKKYEQVEGIEIANPLYDVVFKRLMDNSRVASYFIETFIGEKVESITMLTKESPAFKWSRKFEKLNLTQEELDRLKKLTIIQLDFVATIKTETGEYKKVLIEIQKARNTMDVMRFRHYLAEHYKRKDTVTLKDKTSEAILPIITIYLLGFNLKETDAVVIGVKHNTKDLRTQKLIEVKIPFIEYLTHDCYVIQLGRITGAMKTRVDKVLSVFEQKYFIDEKKITKKYPHSADDAVVELMLDILEHVSADPAQRAEIELEWASHELLSALVMEKDKKITIQAKDIESLKKEKASLKKEKATLAKDNASLAKENAAKDNRITTLAEEKAALTKENADMAEENAAMAKELAELKNRLGINQ